MIGGGAALVTALAAVVGMLNQLGFVENHPSSPTRAKAPAGLSTDAPSETAPVAANKSCSGNEAAASSATFATSQSGKTFNLTGAWRDTGMGACHLILQTGLDRKVTQISIPTRSKSMSHGEGTIAGSHVELHLKTGAPNFNFHQTARCFRVRCSVRAVPVPLCGNISGPPAQHPAKNRVSHPAERRHYRSMRGKLWTARMLTHACPPPGVLVCCRELFVQLPVCEEPDGIGCLQ
jgi:hypothetical protein